MAFRRGRGGGGISTRVQVDGLRDLRRDFRQIKEPNDRKELRDGLKAAAKVIADEAKSRVPSRTGRTAKSIRTGSAWQKGSVQAFVIGGKATVPHYGWLDFGSRDAASGNPRSVGPWTKTGRGPKGGRFIYPALTDKEREVQRLVEQAMNDALNKLNL